MFIIFTPVSIFPSPIASTPSVNRLNSIFSFVFALACMTSEALNLSVLTSTITLDPKCVRWIASSMATSHHPITTNGLFLNIGNAHSQIAQAEIPFCRYSFSPVIPRRFAVAPVAMMTVFASKTSFPLKSFNGCPLKSTLSIVLVSILAPQLIACSLIFIISSIPSIHFGRPGKFSTLLVVVSCPPAATPPAINPSNISGLRFALAA